MSTSHWLEAILKTCLDLLDSRPDLDTLINFFGAAVPALRLLRTTPQDPEWHAEGDVHVHTQMVLDELYRAFDQGGLELSAETQRVLVLGALFHDVAKVWTTRRSEIRGVERVVAPHHEAQGRSTIAPVLVETGLSWDAIWQVMGIVGCHQEPKRLVVKDKPAGDYKALARRVDPFLVSFFERADMRGRTCSDLPLQLEHLDWFDLGMAEYAPSGWLESWRAWFSDRLSNRSTAVRDRVFGEAIRAAEAGRVNTPEEAEFLAYQERDEPPQLVVLCGPSGSGKTTFIKNHLPDYEVVSMDDLREELAGERSDQSLNGAVRQAAQAQLKAALRPGRKVVWDATSLRRDQRAMICELGFTYRALVTLVTFHLTQDEYSARNKVREHAVPQRVLDNQLLRWEYPDVQEAHRLLVVDDKGKTRGAFGFMNTPGFGD